jgi:hypothetical protein
LYAENSPGPNGQIFSNQALLVGFTPECLIILLRLPAAQAKTSNEKTWRTLQIK